MTEKEKLLGRVRMYDFALVEVIEYLDGHPDNAAALKYYNEMRTAFDKAAAEYEDAFGPLTAREVDTRTTYEYCYFQCAYCGNHWHGYGFPCYTWGGGCGQGTIQEGSWHEVWGTIPQSEINWQDWHGTGHTYTIYNGERVFRNINEPNASRTEYRYRDRQEIPTYHYSRWGNWSSYSDNHVSSSSNRQVRTQTVYRYRTR